MFSVNLWFFINHIYYFLYDYVYCLPTICSYLKVQSEHALLFWIEPLSEKNMSDNNNKKVSQSLKFILLIELHNYC